MLASCFRLYSVTNLTDQREAFRITLVDFLFSFDYRIRAKPSITLTSEYTPKIMAAASRYPQLTWKQTSLGYFEREIDEAECIYTCLAK
jgi:hypothetical protein